MARLPGCNKPKEKYFALVFRCDVALTESSGAEFFPNQWRNLGSEKEGFGGSQVTTAIERKKPETYIIIKSNAPFQGMPRNLGNPKRQRSATDRPNNMSGYEIVDTNAENIGGCGFCGRKDPNNEGYRRKSKWLKKRYAEGLWHKVLRSRECGDIGTIEYVPGDQAWRLVEQTRQPFPNPIPIAIAPRDDIRDYLKTIRVIARSAATKQSQCQ